MADNNGILSKIKKFFTLEDFEMEADAEEEEEIEDVQDFQSSRLRQKSNVISLPSAKQQNIVIMEPMDLNEAREVADNLKCRKPIIVNLQKAEKEMARRIVDFISGVTYALEGNVQKVQEEIFLFTPSNISIIPPSKKEQKELQEHFFLK
ncbi:MAG: cell division protein SepF [Candidatus Eremiobacterota bacterium]